MYLPIQINLIFKQLYYNKHRLIQIVIVLKIYVSVGRKFTISVQYSRVTLLGGGFHPT